MIRCFSKTCVRNKEGRSCGRTKCEKSHNHVLSRVRVRTRCQEFLSFCCHKCHSILRKLLFLNSLRYTFRFIFTKMMISRHILIKIIAKNRLSAPSSSSVFLHFCSIFLPMRDTCDSKKSTSLLDGAQTRVCVRTPIQPFCKIETSNSIYWQNKMSLFLGFFPLWGYIDPYTNGRAEKHSPFLLLPKSVIRPL